MRGGTWRVEPLGASQYRLLNTLGDAHEVTITARGLTLDGHLPGHALRIALARSNEPVPLSLTPLHHTHIGHLLITWHTAGDTLADAIAIAPVENR